MLILPECSLLSIYHIISRYTLQCNLIYVRKKRAPFSGPIFNETHKAQQYYVNISYTGFHPNRTINMDSTYLLIYLLTYLLHGAESILSS